MTGIADEMLHLKIEDGPYWFHNSHNNFTYRKNSYQVTDSMLIGLIVEIHGGFFYVYTFQKVFNIPEKYFPAISGHTYSKGDWVTYYVVDVS